MASALPTQLALAGSDDAQRARGRLVRARRAYFEDPAAALAEAICCYEIARSHDDSGLAARARALQGVVCLHRGDLDGALELVVDAERYSDCTRDDAAATEVAALKAQLSLFTGSYAEALSHAERAIHLADHSQDADLRIFARRATCLIFGNVGVGDWRHRLDELLELTIASGDRWEEAISRNDLACYLQGQGDLEGAEHEIDRALAVASTVTSRNGFALAVIYSTRADIRLLAGRAEEALTDAERAIALLTADAEPNPYVLGATVRAEVEARMALGQLDDAQQSGEGALAWLGDRVPQTRSLILSTLASALRQSGRVEDAYDALSRAAELERQAFRELSELQLSLERATLETHAARRESEALAAKNRELAVAHAELERRASQLEVLQAQLRDQADRDWLTGLHNRRYLARELERLAREPTRVPLSLAVLDLDHFKSINDRFGHATGDQVLVRVGRLLSSLLRGTDIAVRSGGEEFLVLMPSTDAGEAAACCARILEAIREEAWERIAAGLTVTTSLGVASTSDPGDLKALVQLADQRLYDAKQAGRDRVVSAPRHQPAPSELARPATFPRLTGLTGGRNSGGRA
jgi:diguanylate cyclase (GGDEF)-like protein